MQYKPQLPSNFHKVLSFNPEMWKGSLQFMVSKKYNYIFNRDNGMFARWGNEIKDDPNFSPFGPEIMDIEISTICEGVNGKPCKFCYKSNTQSGENMSFNVFKKIFHKIPRTLTQIAFGIGTINGNPDIWKILGYCRQNSYNIVIPNITINGWDLKDVDAKNLAKICGSVAVSHYDEELCISAIRKLYKFGVKQINIHQVLTEETYYEALNLLESIKSKKLSKIIHAIVFLSLKQKGRGKTYRPLLQKKFDILVKNALNSKIKFGFDSCSALKVNKVLFTNSSNSLLKMMVESCEACLFSGYINCQGEFFPCSFIEGEKDFSKGINILKVNDFLKDVWFSQRIQNFRNSLIFSSKINDYKCRECPIFTI